MGMALHPSVRPSSNKSTRLTRLEGLSLSPQSSASNDGLRSSGADPFVTAQSCICSMLILPRHVWRRRGRYTKCAYAVTHSSQSLHCGYGYVALRVGVHVE